MSVSAWIFMALVWSVILAMVGYCFFKLLTSKIQLGEDDPPAPPAARQEPRPPETGITKLPGD